MVISETSTKFICKCDFCGKEFSDYKSNRNHNPPKFCSSKCYHDSTRKQPFYKMCEYCGRKFEVRVKHIEKRFCNNKCASAYKSSRAEHKVWRNKDGYRELWIKNRGCVKEHIYVMEQYLGRKLKKNEVVHHKDFNKANNDISNLQLMTKSEHSSFHRKYEISMNGNSKNLSYRTPKGHIPHNARKVIRIEDGKIYESTGKCAEDIDGKCKSVWKVCTGKQKTYKGFHFKYLD